VALDVGSCGINFTAGVPQTSLPCPSVPFAVGYWL